MRKYLPITLGLALGAVSVIMGQIPVAAAQFSGMTVIGNHTGYLLGALVIAWMNYESWLKAFISSLITMTAANLTYYLSIIAFYVFNIGRSAFPPAPIESLEGFAYWTLVSSAVCALAAAAVWIARRAKSKWLNYGVFAATYAGMLGVIYYYQLRFVIRWYNNSMVRDGFIETRRFAGYLYEISFAIILTTIVLSVGLRALVNEKKTAACQA